MRMGALLLGAAAVAGLAAGCGGSSGTPPANAAANGGNGFAAYTQCLARNGVVLPSASARADRTGGVRPSNRPSTRPSGGTGNGGGFGGGGFAFGNQPPAGVDQATWDKAMQACASVRPSFAAGGNGGANNSELVAYRNCLSEHGVTFPSAGARGGGGGGFAGLNTADPKVAAALSACAPLRPSGGPRPTPTP